jgi:hypothetical protein
MPSVPELLLRMVWEGVEERAGQALVVVIPMVDAYVQQQLGSNEGSEGLETL